MRAHALSLSVLLVLALLPLTWRGPRDPAPLRPCLPEGRGTEPRGWLGCAGDPGPPRALSAAERLVLGLPIDPNSAGEAELAQVPGLSRSLAQAIVAHRSQHGRFAGVDGLLEVKGIGPRRLERARARLAVGPDGAGGSAAP